MYRSFAYIYSLYQKIDTEKLQCLNEAEEGSGKTVFKPWDERFDRSKVHIDIHHYCTNMYCIIIDVFFVDILRLCGH